MRAASGGYCRCRQAHEARRRAAASATQPPSTTKIRLIGCYLRRMRGRPATAADVAAVGESIVVPITPPSTAVPQRYCCHHHQQHHHHYSGRRIEFFYVSE